MDDPEETWIPPPDLLTAPVPITDESKKPQTDQKENCPSTPKRKKAKIHDIQLEGSPVLGKFSTESFPFN